MNCSDKGLGMKFCRRSLRGCDWMNSLHNNPVKTRRAGERLIREMNHLSLMISDAA